MMSSFLRGSRRWFLLGMLALLGETVCAMLNPRVVQVTVDSVLGDQPDALLNGLLAWAGGREVLREKLWLVALVVIALGLLAAGLRRLYVVCVTKGGEGFIRAMRDQSFAHIQKLPFSWHVSHHTGDIIQRCTVDIETVKEFLSSQFVELLNSLLTITAAMVCMFGENTLIAWAVLATEPILLAYSVYFGGKFSNQYQMCDECDGELSTIAQENLTGVRVVRAFGREEWERARFNEKSVESTKKWVKLGLYMSAYFEMTAVLIGLQRLVVLALGSVLVVRGELTAGSMLALIAYTTIIQMPTRALGRVISEMSKASVSVNRLYEIMSAPVEQDVPEAMRPPMTGDIVFDHVTFGYPGCPTLLEDISFTVPAGTKLGILGSTGSGKSTMMHLLDRLYDLPEGCGTITVGGVPLSKMEAGWVRRSVGMVLQEPMLFSDTLENNIAMGADHPVSLEEVRRAASVASLDEAVQSFARGYDTVVGERGVTLSGGQKQRAAIARMLLQNAPIMIFDDSLSAVDAETDAKIQSALQTQLAGSTCILISHRISTLMSADRILVLDKGRIVQQGNHEELITQEGLYRTIYRLQSGEEV